MQKIIQAYTTDEIAKGWEKQGKDQPFQYCGKTYVPETLLEEWVSDHYDDPRYGHPRVSRTMGLICRTWSSPKMKTAIEEYIKSCPSC